LESAIPGIVTSAIPRGRLMGLFEYWSRSVTRRTVTNVIFRCEPCRGGKATLTVWVVHGVALSARAGSSTVRVWPSALTAIEVGTECLPSVTTAIERWSKVIGFARLYWSQFPACGPRPGLQTVARLPSSVD